MNMHARPRPWLQCLGALALALAATLSACGGGDGVGVGGTGGYAQGPISGFGSVIVNGIRFDDGAPTLVIENEDGTRLERAALGLGMLAQVESGAIATAANGDRSATARRIVIGSELLGRIDALAASADGLSAELRIVGQRVAITPATAFGRGFGGGLGTLALGQVVEVYGNAGADGIVATRIELRDAATAAFRVRGRVDDWSPGGGSTGRFTIGDASFAYDGPAPPAGFAEGAYVKLRVGTATAGGAWPVAAIELNRRAAPDVDDAEFKGTVSTFTSLQAFGVGGQPVTTDAGTRFPDGTGIALGSYVEVHGRVSGGVLRATEVSIEDGSGSDGGEFDLRGTMSSLNRTNKTFVLQGQLIDYAQSPQYDGGSEATLADGLALRVKARMSADRTKLVATEVRFGD